MSKIELKNVRLSFPDLFVAKPFKPGDEPKFKATFLVPKNSAQIAEIEAAILEAATAKWGPKAKGIVAGMRTNTNKFCFQDGDNATYEGYEGMMSLSAKNKARPLVVNRDRTPLNQEDGKPYAGCYVNASIEFFTYDNSGKGISASLRWVQFLRDGDAFAGGTPADPNEIPDLGDGADAGDLV